MANQSSQLFSLPNEILGMILENTFELPSNKITINPDGELVPHALLRTCRFFRENYLTLW